MPIDSFVAKVYRNVRGQYQFKTAEVTSDLSAAMFFGGIDLSIEYTKQIATWRALDATQTLQ